MQFSNTKTVKNGKHLGTGLFAIHLIWYQFFELIVVDINNDS